MKWYEELFKNYSESYEKEPFTKGTKGEVDFIESEIKYDKSISILDIGCGTGRHSIELSSRGYKVTGVDLSANMLKKARKKAASLNLEINFLIQDARKLNLINEFELVIMICEGAFPLMETDEMNFSILKNASKALKEKGKFIFTTLNGLFPLFHSVKDFINAGSSNGISKTNTFDLMTFRDYSEYKQTDDNGNEILLKCNERYYIPSEITWLLKSLNFTKIEIFGCELGKWDRKKPLTTDNFEMLVVAEK